MRSKLKLDLETLAVDSFDTANETAENGTVFGEQCTCWTNCTCPGCPSCDASCGGTCDASCNGTCYEQTCANCGTGGYTCLRTCGQTALYTACGDLQCY